MNRTQSTDAIVLRTNRIGEIHRGVVLLSRDLGLVRAIAHGANSPRGKLRGSTVVLASGRVFLYTNPRTESVKITDFDATEFHSGIRKDLRKYFTASLWSEVILLSFGSGGHADSVFDLMTSALRILDQANANGTDLISIQFLWRFLGLSGLQPDLNLCACCGEAIARQDGVVYAASEHGFCAESHGCAGEADSEALRWTSGARMYLQHAASLPIEDSIRVVPPSGATQALKRVMYSMIQDLVETPLKTLESGAGII